MGDVDQRILETVAGWRNGPADELFRALSSTELRLLLLGLAMLVVARRVQPAWLGAAVPAAAAIATAAITDALKDLTARQRPDALGALIDLPPSASFPSGHASGAFAVATVVWLLAGRRWGGVALAVAAAIALSRVWLGVHYPSDVVAGAALGALCGWLVVTALQAGVRRRRRQPGAAGARTRSAPGRTR